MPLTELQEKFAVAYVTNGGDATKAAIDAGYAHTSARELGYKALHHQGVQEAIVSSLTRLRGRSGAVGWNVMIRIAEDDKAPAAARVSAARALMEHAGMLGTAKDVGNARLVADRERPIDYLAVLDSMRAVISVTHSVEINRLIPTEIPSPANGRTIDVEPYSAFDRVPSQPAPGKPTA